MHGATLIAKDSFVIGLLKYYNSLCGFISEKYTNTGNMIYLEIFKDSFKLITNLCRLGSSRFGHTGSPQDQEK